MTQSVSGKSLVDSNIQSTGNDRTLMRTKYCIKYELDLCPKHQGAAQTGPLYLINNGRRLALRFDCSRCEMTVEKP